MGVAKLWADADTPYAPRYKFKILVPGSGKYAGGNPVKGEGADCSGATWKIYEEAGFSYGSYHDTATFPALVGTDANFIKGKHFFKKVDTPQVGDIGWWNGHMAIYDPNAGKTEKGLVGNLWSASHPDGRDFGSARVDFYDNKHDHGTVNWYRYWKAP